MDGCRLVRMTAVETRAPFLVQKSWLPPLCKLKLHNRTLALNQNSEKALLDLVSTFLNV